MAAARNSMGQGRHNPVDGSRPDAMMAPVMPGPRWASRPPLSPSPNGVLGAAYCGRPDPKAALPPFLAWIGLPAAADRTLCHDPSGQPRLARPARAFRAWRGAHYA